MWRTDRLRGALTHAFALDSGAEFSEQERDLVERLAGLVVRRRMATPAIMALEGARPLSFIGSQALAFFGPILRAAFSADDYDRLVHLLERRHSLDLIIETIQRQEDEYRG